MLNKIRRHVLHVVDTASKLTALAKIVDAYEESLAAAGTLGVLVGIALGSAVAKLLWCGGRKGGTGAPLHLGVGTGVYRGRHMILRWWWRVIPTIGLGWSLKRTKSDYLRLPRRSAGV